MAPGYIAYLSEAAEIGDFRVSGFMIHFEIFSKCVWFLAVCRLHFIELLFVFVGAVFVVPRADELGIAT